MGPVNAGNDRTVMLDCYPVAFQVEVGDQILEIGPGRQLRKFTRLAVEDEVHKRRLTDCVKETAGPSTALRFGRDDKGRAVTLRKDSDPDGQS
jgi:hypothetical protein